uniref:Uncharacterized protein n=1 Tax=Leersia perrieri TaxID=77586 RepID=A0A0D9WQS4_9ORYZ
MDEPMEGTKHLREQICPFARRHFSLHHPPQPQISLFPTTTITSLSTTSPHRLPSSSPLFHITPLSLPLAAAAAVGAMDKQLGFSEFIGNSSNPGNAEKWTIIRPPAIQPTVCPKQLDVLAQDSIHNLISRGIKRKWVDLSLGLGNSSSSSDSSKQSMETCCTMSSAKDRDDGSSFDINFQFNLHNEGTSKLDRNECNGKRLEKPVDLELSLTVGTCESAVTNVDFSTATKHQSVLLQSCNMSSVPAVDEGSTSARWKSGGKLLPYLYQSGNNIGVFSSKEFPGSSNQSQDLVLPPTMIQLPQSPVVQKVLEVLQGVALLMEGVKGAREKVARKEQRGKPSSVKHMEVVNAVSTLDAQRVLKVAQISA